MRDYCAFGIIPLRSQYIDHTAFTGKDTVDQNEVIILLDFVEIVSQHDLAAHGVDQRYLHGRKDEDKKTRRYETGKRPKSRGLFSNTTFILHFDGLIMLKNTRNTPCLKIGLLTDFKMP